MLDDDDGCVASVTSRCSVCEPRRIVRATDWPGSWSATAATRSLEPVTALPADLGDDVARAHARAGGRAAGGDRADGRAGRLPVASELATPR